MNDPVLRIRRRQTRVRGLLGVVAMLFISSAPAQYAADGAADDHAEEGVRYFGSAKDEKGALLADVTFRIEGENEAFIFVTNTNGRFRGMLPTDIPFATVKTLCFKPGLEPVRITKRPGPKAAKQASVQVDCVLRKAVAA